MNIAKNCIVRYCSCNIKMKNKYDNKFLFLDKSVLNDNGIVLM